MGGVMGRARDRVGRGLGMGRGEVRGGARAGRARRWLGELSGGRRRMHWDTTLALYVQGPSTPGPKDTCAPTTPLRGGAQAPLRHDPEDGVVAADARAAVLVVLLAVADLQELRS